MSYGGARANAGRKKGQKAWHTLEASKMREHFVTRVKEHAEELFQAKLDLALGHKILRTTERGEEKVYTVSPDPSSARYLWDQSIGKPTETVKLDADVTLKLDV